jgi:hypothetical protein
METTRYRGNLRQVDSPFYPFMVDLNTIQFHGGDDCHVVPARPRIWRPSGFRGRDARFRRFQTLKPHCRGGSPITVWALPKGTGPFFGLRALR